MDDVRRQKTDVIRELLNLVLDDHTPEPDRAAAGNSLRRIADGSVLEALSRIVDETQDETLLSDLSEILSGVINSPDTIASMISMCWHDAAQVRRAAMKSLSKSRSKEAAAALAILLSDLRQTGSIFDGGDERLARRARDCILGRAVP